MTRDQPSPRPALSALYYPYADVVGSPALLEAALYFDTVYILEPNFFRYPTLAGEPQVPHTAAMRELVAARIVEPIGPKLFGLPATPFTARATGGESVQRLLADGVAADARDAGLLALANGAGYASWAIPSGQQIFWNGLGLLLNHDDDIVQAQSTRPAYYSRFFRDSGLRDVAVASPQDRIRESRLRTSGNELLVEVPFIYAESLMLGLTLLACSELDLYPFTDSRFHYRFMRGKLARASQTPGLARVAERVHDGIREAELALDTLALGLPRLSDLTPERVIELRSECGDSLARFRSHLHRLRHQIESTPWSPLFRSEIETMIETTIEPDLQALRDDLEARGKRLGINVGRAIGRAAPLPLLITLAANVPAPVALAAGAGIAAGAEVADYLLDRGRAKRNGLYFLLEAG